MTLGILVNTDRHRDDVIGIAEAAVRKGHKVILFFMDRGCLLAMDEKVASLCAHDAVRMSLCDLNRQQLGIAREDYVPRITCGSQYDNADMVREADRVIVL